MSNNNQSDSEERSKREASRSKDAVSGQSVSPSTHSRRSNNNQSDSEERSKSAKNELSRSKDAVSGQSVSPSTHSRRSNNNQSDSEERSKREASRSKDAVSGQSVSPSTHSRRSSVVSNNNQFDSEETNLGLPSTLVHDEASGNELTGAELSNDDHDLVDDSLSDFKSSDDLPVTTASHKNKPREKRNSKTLSDNSESASLSDKYSRKTRSQKRENLP